MRGFCFNRSLSLSPRQLAFVTTSGSRRFAVLRLFPAYAMCVPQPFFAAAVRSLEAVLAVSTSTLTQRPDSTDEPTQVALSMLETCAVEATSSTLTSRIQELARNYRAGHCGGREPFLPVDVLRMIFLLLLPLGARQVTALAGVCTRW